MLTEFLLVLALKAGDHPIFGVIGEFPDLVKCRAAIEKVDDKEPDKVNLHCLEIVIHVEEGKQQPDDSAKPVPPNNGRRMGNTT
jgi:hypothetical protein